MPSKSKNKGNTFEREISKFLSDLYGESFVRVVTSGAFTGGKNVVRKEYLSENQIRSHKGDIVPPDDWKYFNCEAKFYQDFPFHNLLCNTQVALLESWLDQLLQTTDEGDCNILVMKFNRKGRYIAFQKGELFKTVTAVDYHDKAGNHWVITGFDSFIELNQDLFKKRCIEGKSAFSS